MAGGQKEKLKKAMGLFDLVLFNVVAIVGLRWTALAAGAGPSSIILWIAAMIFFFIPSALIVTELSGKCPCEGGIYVWTRRAFGDFHGFVCGFFYWVNNLIYYPNLLIFLGGVFLYVGGEKYLYLEDNSLYAATFSMIVLWIAILVNMVGLKTGRWLQNLGSLGSWIPAGVLITVAGISWYKFSSATDFSANMMPDPGSFKTISIFANLCFGFAGMELAACMSEEIKDPRKNIPRAIFVSAAAISLIYILGTAALLVALPAQKINVISGVVQVIAEIGRRVNVFWIGPVIALFITIGGLGGCGAWLSGTARVPFVIGIDHYLPPWMARVHPRWGTPANAILVQGVVSSVFIIMSAIGSTVKETYTILIDATIILYFIPYLYLFASFLRFKKMPHLIESQPQQETEILEGCNMEGAPVKFNYHPILGYMGLITTAIAIILALIPPDDAKSKLVYEFKVVGGVLFFWVVGWIIFRRAVNKIG